MTIQWTPTALRDLTSLHSYIAEDNSAAAYARVAAVLTGIESLARYPQMGRKGRVSATRELVVAPYGVAYRVRRTAIEIVAIIHGARRWPDSF